MVCEEVRGKVVDVCCFQEARWRGQGSRRERYMSFCGVRVPFVIFRHALMHVDLQTYMHALMHVDLQTYMPHAIGDQSYWRKTI